MVCQAGRLEIEFWSWKAGVDDYSYNFAKRLSFDDFETSAVKGQRGSGPLAGVTDQQRCSMVRYGMEREK